MNTSITEDSTVANEGGTLSFTITSPSTSLNKSLYWSTEQEGLEGTLTASDFTVVSLTGILWTSPSPQTFTITLSRDGTLREQKDLE